jgi:hypothetical protein
MTTPRDPVQFTRESAERVANVVRAIELAAPQGKPLSFDAVQSLSAPKPFRIATFTAAWATGTEQVLTFHNQTTTPNTVMATNLLYRVEPPSTTEPQICAIAKAGTAWHFVNAGRGCPNAQHKEFLSAQTSDPEGDSFDTLIALPGDNCVKWTKATKKRVVSDISIVTGSQPALRVTYMDVWVAFKTPPLETVDKLFPVADCES